MNVTNQHLSNSSLGRRLLIKSSGSTDDIPPYKQQVQIPLPAEIQYRWHIQRDSRYRLPNNLPNEQIQTQITAENTIHHVQEKVSQNVFVISSTKLGW